MLSYVIQYKCEHVLKGYSLSHDQVVLDIDRDVD